MTTPEMLTLPELAEHLGVWKPIPAYPGYEASSDGRIRSVSRVIMRSNGVPLSVPTRLLTPHRRKSNGYCTVHMRINNTDVTRTVHRLVAAAFYGPLPPKMNTRHLNGVRHDNWLSNLAYGTPTENSYDMIAHGHNHCANKTHCKAGHEFSPANTYRPPAEPRRRQCRACKLLAAKRKRVESQ